MLFIGTCHARPLVFLAHVQYAMSHQPVIRLQAQLTRIQHLKRDENRPVVVLA
jgi:hypothetical protein